MTQQPERRSTPRIATDLSTFFFSAPEEGPAVLANVSPTGALLALAQTELRPRVGASVRLSVILRNQILHAMGKVVRQTERGFAIEFDTRNPALYDAVT